MAKVEYSAVGRRKKAVARVRLVAGDGKITINKRDIDNYFGLETLKMTVRQPLTLTNTGNFDVFVNAFFNFFRKLGQVIAAICVNGALLNMNYKYEKGAVQTLENLKKMYNLATLIPAILFALMAVILFAFYPLSKKRVEKLQVEKEAKLRESYENKTIDIAKEQ